MKENLQLLPLEEFYIMNAYDNAEFVIDNGVVKRLKKELDENE